MKSCNIRNTCKIIKTNTKHYLTSKMISKLNQHFSNTVPSNAKHYNIYNVSQVLNITLLLSSVLILNCKWECKPPCHVLIFCWAMFKTEPSACQSSSHTYNIGTCWEPTSMYIGGAWSVPYLQEPWCVSAQRGVLNCSHYPSQSLLPSPSGCWCHYTAAGSPSCQSLSARWCSWCPGWRKTHSTCNSDTETQKHPKSVHTEEGEYIAWYQKLQKTDRWNVCERMFGRFSSGTEHLFLSHQRSDDVL